MTQHDSTITATTITTSSLQPLLKDATEETEEEGDDLDKSTQVLHVACRTGDLFRAQQVFEVALEGYLDDDDACRKIITSLMLTLDTSHQFLPLHLVAYYDQPLVLDYLLALLRQYCLPDHESLACAYLPSFVALLNARAGEAKYRATALMLATSVNVATRLVEHGAEVIIAGVWDLIVNVFNVDGINRSIPNVSAPLSRMQW